MVELASEKINPPTIVPDVISFSGLVPNMGEQYGSSMIMAAAIVGIFALWLVINHQLLFFDS